MRTILGLCLFTGMSFAGGGDPAKPNTLPAADAAGGWLLLFDGETKYGWTCATSDKLTAKDGALRFEGPGELKTSAPFFEFAWQFEFRVTGAKTHHDVQLQCSGWSVEMATPKETKAEWKLGKLMVTKKDCRFVVTHGGTQISVSANQFQATPGTLCFLVASGVSLELRSVALFPLGQSPLFNGKNLEGWKEFAGKKYTSKFTVNDKLELNVKDGPGDLQTDSKYADFLLQLECFSNGKFLNSGIFFRCKPGEYQNGYECQIRNQFTAEAKQKYVIEHFDPVTNQPKDKETVFLTAVDYGTGAIYRRMPARKQMAKDGEWFTLTIVAHGNHFATWVNGVQVCDWTDNRAANANPRNGCRLEAGHISIQGHDPTTDLSFRNLRIAEYPAPTKK